MNCPVRTEPFPDEGHNQNPPELAAELTTRRSLNTPRGVIGSRRIDLSDDNHDPGDDSPATVPNGETTSISQVRNRISGLTLPEPDKEQSKTRIAPIGSGAAMLRRTLSRGDAHDGTPDQAEAGRFRKGWAVVKHVVVKYTKFIGPGFMVSVAYIDPGNYATDVAAGATFRYRLLFIVLLSNLFAIFLQSLCIKLGTVTGMNLAENCKAHLPKWLNYVLYGFAEAAIIATDIAEVIGTAIALNILLKIPLVAGCALSIVDVLIILFFYNPTGMSMRALRFFEIFVILLVLGVVICFCYELSKIQNTTVGEVFKGYLPSKAVVQSQGLYQSCGILGATVMPHSLYLGSGIVQNRLRDFDERNNGLEPLPKSKLFTFKDDDSAISVKYRPSLSAIRSCLTYSIIELGVSLFTFALFVNSAILITAGASLSNLPKEQTDDADLFSIHQLLSTSIAPVAGTMFALALLLSGTSAGIVCTIAGQMVSEGQLSWTLKPWVRRLITRAISITPSIIIAGAVGRKGLSAALEGSQVALSVILPFVSAPLIYFTWSAKVMSVAVDAGEISTNATAGQHDAHDVTIEPWDTTSQRDLAVVNNTSSVPQTTAVSHSLEENNTAAESALIVMKNGWIVSGFALAIWGLITVMNVALLVLLGLGTK